MTEKHYDHNIDIHMLFIDFKLAFDSVDRHQLIEELHRMKKTTKLIRLTEINIGSTKAGIKIGNNVSKTFEYNKGVKQGEGISTTLFLIALHRVVKKIDQRGTVVAG